MEHRSMDTPIAAEIGAPIIPDVFTHYQQSKRVEMLAPHIEHGLDFARYHIDTAYNENLMTFFEHKWYTGDPIANPVRWERITEPVARLVRLKSVSVDTNLRLAEMRGDIQRAHALQPVREQLISAVRYLDEGKVGWIIWSKWHCPCYSSSFRCWDSRGGN